MRTLMKVLKNLFGNNTKINANNIAVKKADNSADTLDNCVIVDSGSNSNGIWIKFGDGKLISAHQVTRRLSRTSAWGNMYETSQQANLGDYPVEFKDTPYIFLTLYGQNALFESVNNPSKTNAGNVYLIAPTRNDSADYTIQVLAIGRWK